MRLHATADLTPDELLRSLAALAEAEGLVEPLGELLEKAERTQAALRLPRERYLLEMVEVLRRRYLAQVDRLATNLQRWIDATFPGHGPWELRKAKPGTLLTGQQIQELRQLIEAHFQVEPPGTPGGPEWRIPEPVWREWQQLGIVVPTLPLPEIESAWIAGRLYQVIRDGETYARMLQLARQHPLTRPQQLAVQWAERHAAEHVVGLGQRLAAQAVQRALTVQQQLARGLIVRYLRGELKVTTPPPGVPHDLTPEERAALETERAVTSWRGLARELYQQFRGSDAQRDWLRVAASETRLAYNAGRLQAMEEQGLRKIYYLVQPDACEHCRRLLLHPDGTPRVFRLGDVLATLATTGGTNVGRKASKIGDPQEGWVVTGGILHPHCRCKPVPRLPSVDAAHRPGVTAA